MALTPHGTIHITEKGRKGLERFFDLSRWNIRTVKTGDVLKTGKRTLLFIETPMLHWPDSMMTYIREDKMLISQDGFGQHIASAVRFDDEYQNCESAAALHNAVVVYYANFLMPFGQIIKSKIAEIQKMGIEVDMIAPDHGIIWRKNVGKVLQSYLDMAGGKANPSVSIIYANYPFAFVLISHDRYFLDGTVKELIEIWNKRVWFYPRNYTKVLQLKEERLDHLQAQARNQNERIEQLEAFISRFRAQATMARQAQSRLKMLERLAAVEPARARREWRFEFPAPRRLPERLLDAEDLRLAYGPRTILDGVKFLIRSGDRIGILGVNGAGKSTLVRSIAGELAPAGGELRRGNGLAIGYFAQHQLDQLRADESPLQHLRRQAAQTEPQAREQALRNFLGQFRFGGELASSPVGPMSGGEKAPWGGPAAAAR